MSRPTRLLLLLGLLVLAAVMIVPLTLTTQADDYGIAPLIDKAQLRELTLIAMFVALAASWNIIGGLTGYAAFGNVAYFGLGAYTTAVLVDPHKGNLPFAVALIASPVVPALVAVLIGLPLLRLRGHYFAVATLGAGIAVGEVIKNIEYLGGATGLFPPIMRRADVLFFYLMAGAAILAVLVTWQVKRSRFGYGLIAIRENEEAARVLGVNTTLYKISAYALAAALAGLAGGVFAQWNSFISQENVFPIEYNVYMILMALVGGAGTVLGPVAGAIVLEALILALAGRADVAVFAQMGLGVLLAVTVIFIPRGVIDFFGGQSRLSIRYLRRSLRETSV